MAKLSEPDARFLTGSTMRHVTVMAGTGAIGLVAVFAVDLINLIYISLLGQQTVAAAVGFAGTVGFFQVSITIGLTIGLSTAVSLRVGAGQMADARRVATAGLVLVSLLTALVAVATVAAVNPILELLGAEGETRRLAAGYLVVTAVSVPAVSVGMGFAALLRAVGDARGSMMVTLAAAFATAVLDPLLIFGLGLDLTGAAISTVLSRALLAFVGWHGAARRHDLLGPFELSAFTADARAVLAVSGPAVLANLATPVGAAYVTSSMATFGPAAVAGQATIDRITPVAFGLVYALTGAVGPVVAQNLGAGRFDRVRSALRDSLIFVLVAVVAAWVLLWLGQDLLIAAFSAQGVTAEIVRLFCDWVAGSFMFVGALYVSNAAFNNLGRPLLSTAFNWGRATLGTIPLVALGATYGPEGVLVGQALGAVLFGTAACFVAFTVTRRLGPEGRSPVSERGDLSVATPTGTLAIAAPDVPSPTQGADS
ncbi:MATE family efflux transporter [Roseomonas sp. WA12]